MPRLALAWEMMVAGIVALAGTIALLTAAESGLPQRLEGLSLDLRFRLRPEHRLPPPLPLIVVAVDDASIAEIGRWPWSRAVLARFVDRMHAAGAKVVAIDLLLTEAQVAPLAARRADVDAAFEPLLRRLGAVDRVQVEATLSDLMQRDSADEALAAAIRRHGAVIVGFNVDLRPGTRASTARFASPDLVRVAFRRTRGDAPDRLPSVAGYILPIEVISRAALLAHVTTVPDSSGTPRFDYPLLRYDDGYLPSLSLEAVRAFLGMPATDVIVDLGRGIELNSLHVPTDEGMRLLVNDQPPGSFERVSFADALAGRVADDRFAGRIVLLGATASALGDVVATPFSPSVPGVERHAALIENMLDADFLRRDASLQAVDALLIVLTTLGVGFLSRRGTIASALAAASMLAGVATLDVAAFVGEGWWLNFTVPAMAIVLTFGLILGGKYAVERHRRKWIRHAFSRYLDIELVDQLCRRPSALRLGGEERELTVLFADIRDFTHIAERLPAAQLVSLLNEFFSAMTAVVLENRGMLDKYLGDGLMALFGAPLTDRCHASNACRASIGMHGALARLNRQWHERGWPCLEMRVGINTGRVVVGNVGTEQRFDYTAIGDEVNVAARLEAANKSLGTAILVSAATVAAAGAGATVRALGAIAVKGRAQAVEVFELLAAEGPPPGCPAGAEAASDPNPALLRSDG
jgi:adenylate cyclase